MGWLFGSKKKVPRVPLPEGRVIDEKALQFPMSESSSRAIGSDDIRAAVADSISMGEPISAPSRSSRPTVPKVSASRFVAPKPHFVRVEVYQQLLAEIEGLRKDIHALDATNRHLDTSEFNEEENYEKVRRSLKSAHDRLQAVDRVLFRVRE